MALSRKQTELYGETLQWTHCYMDTNKIIFTTKCIAMTVKYSKNELYFQMTIRKNGEAKLGEYWKRQRRCVGATATQVMHNLSKSLHKIYLLF